MRETHETTCKMKFFEFPCRVECNGRKVFKSFVHFFFHPQVMDAEKQKAESGAEHQKKAKVFQEAELKVSVGVHEVG